MYGTRLTVAVTALLLSASGRITQASVIYVDRSADGLDSIGQSWCSAFTHLRDAIDRANPGDSIHVAHGAYTPDEGGGAAPGDRTATFRLINGVAVRGGFAGCGAADPDVRDATLYETVLTGDLAGNDAAGFVNYDENAYHVVTALRVEATAVLDGVTVSGGNANGPNFGPSPESQDQGSAVNIYHATPTIRGCTFRSNWSGNHGAVNDHGGATIESCRFEGNRAEMWGGALFIAPGVVASVTNSEFIDNATGGTNGGGGAVAISGESTFTDCRFATNTSDTKGGAVYIHGGGRPELAACSFEENYAVEQGGAIYNTGSDPTLTRCEFIGNTADHVWAGGAIFNDTDTGATITDCYFARNEGPRGGAIWNHWGSTTRIVRCRFEDNLATSNGGAVTSYIDSSPELIDCDFYDNHADVYGGAMYNYHDCTALVSRCRFGGNTAGEFGGAVWNLEADPLFINSTFVGNSAPRAGAIWDHDSGITTLINCTLVANRATDIGGAIVADNGTTIMTNCIIWDNSDASGNTGRSQIYVDAAYERTVDMSYTCFGGSIFGGAGNVDTDPLFVDADGPDDILGTPDDDVRLLPESPCVDGGDNAAIAPGSAADLGGDPRISGLRVDMGAYEVQFAIPAVDATRFAVMILALIVVGSIAFRRPRTDSHRRAV